jgi:hypothetical protein
LKINRGFSLAHEIDGNANVGTLCRNSDILWSDVVDRQRRVRLVIAGPRLILIFNLVFGTKQLKRFLNEIKSQKLIAITWVG